jgi:hypothetical protein
MSALRTVLIALLLLLVHAGCKSPRPPREAVAGDLTGQWTARAAAFGEPRDPHDSHWTLALRQDHGGRLEGSGAVRLVTGELRFDLTGVRGEHVLSFELRLEDGRTAHFDGAVLDMQTLSGSLMLPGDTIPLVFTRPLE